MVFLDARHHSPLNESLCSVKNSYCENDDSCDPLVLVISDLDLVQSMEVVVSGYLRVLSSLGVERSAHFLYAYRACCGS